MSLASRWSIGLGLGCWFALSLRVSDVRADVDVGRLVSMYGSRLTARPSENAPLSVLSRRADGKLRMFVSGPRRANVSEMRGMTELREGLYAWTASPRQIQEFSANFPDYQLTWSAPRRPLLDRARTSVRAHVAQRNYGLTGRGVVVGIVDTGVDVRHPDLRNADGTTRIAWLLDLSKQPTEKHPELEHQFKCDEEASSCAVYDAKDLDVLVNNDISGDEPRDGYGHGTHVASLAVGNGLANDPPVYVGMAPSATLVVVRATRDEDGYIEDPDILLATKFVFEIAERLGMPAVVNLSLGGDFGAHDGTSAIERELSSLVGKGFPGRSIVVAGGNSGMLYDPLNSGYPGPLGIHSTVQVPPQGSARVPLLIGKSGAPEFASQLYVWVAMRPGDELSVGLETRESNWIEPLGLGESAEVERDGMIAVIDNGYAVSDRPATVDRAGALVAVEGNFEQDTVLALKLEGHGTASIWLQPMGGIEPSSNEFGVALPAAQREGTITVPATAPALIAVGASLDRSQWTDIDGESQGVVSGLVRYGIEGEVVPFSAAGPNALDGIKPDLVAPGVYIVGAMSKLTDPRTFTGDDGMFAGGNTCSNKSQTCLLVDDYHALSFGTSMASPVVAGAVALLLEKSPTLSQPDILRLLQAGARNVYDLCATYTQVGAGSLDVEGALLALEDRALGNEVSGAQSYLTLGVAFVRPDPNWPVAGMVHLRDDQARAVDVDVSRMRLKVNNGTVTQPLTRRGPGYYAFAIAGEADRGGQSFKIQLYVDDRLVTEETRAVAVDAPNVQRLAVAGRGCAFTPEPRRSSGWLTFGVFVAGALYARRRSRIAAIAHE